MKEGPLYLLVFSITAILLQSCNGAKPPGLLDGYDGYSGGFGALDAQKFNWSNTPNGFLPLPPGYNRLAIPLGTVSDSILVKVYLSIREVLDVDTKNGIIEIDTEMGLSWFDWQIWEYFIHDKDAQKKAENGPESIILDSEFLRQIWKPDIYIDEMAEIERTKILSDLITLKFLVQSDVVPGLLSYKSRQTMKLRCEMDFNYYPADTQKCTYTIRSYSYTEDQLFLIWDPLDGIYLDQTSDSNYDFQVSNVEPLDTLDNLYITVQTFDIDNVARTRSLYDDLSLNYSALSFTMEIRRNVNYHLVQTYLPSMLLIFVTWLCFLLPPDMVEVRIGISMTTLLTLTAMFAAVREQSPEVSYAMAIDIWMVFCIFSVFIALVLFTFIYWMRRRADRAHSHHGDGGANGHKSMVTVNGDIIIQNPVHAAARDKKFKKILTRSKYAFWMFVVVFLIFLTLYALWLTFFSEYYVWEPSKLYNAVDEDNRLFVRQEHEFAADNDKKATASAKREYNIVTNNVAPILWEVRQKKRMEKAQEEARKEQERMARLLASSNTTTTTTTETTPSASSSQESTNPSTEKRPDANEDKQPKDETATSKPDATTSSSPTSSTTAPPTPSGPPTETPSSTSPKGTEGPNNAEPDPKTE